MFGGEKYHGVAIGVAAAKIFHRHFFAADEDLGFIAERDIGKPSHFARHHVGARVLVNDHLRFLPSHGLIAAGVIAVLVSVQYIFDGLIGNRADLLHDLRRILGKLVIHHQNALLGWHERHVAAAADNHVQIRRYLLHSQLGRCLVL